MAEPAFLAPARRHAARQAFVEHASPHQLVLFGWPPPGHPFWTVDTIAGLRQRYPGIDVATWGGGRAQRLG
jgi:hypothetical protein